MIINKRTFARLAVAIALSCHVHAGEIEKIAITCDTGMCFYWWPKLAEIQGWHHDRENSLHYRFNAQAPDGHTFSDAETVMYARAIYKPRVPDQTLPNLISETLATFERAGQSISNSPDLTCANEMPLSSYRFIPEGQGNWESGAYGEDEEYFYVFVLSSRSETGFNSAINDFENWVRSYK